MQQPETGRSGVEGLEPGADRALGPRGRAGPPSPSPGRTLTLRILLKVVLVEAIRIDAPLLVWIWLIIYFTWLIIYFTIDLVVFASIAVAAT